MSDYTRDYEDKILRREIKRKIIFKHFPWLSHNIILFDEEKYYANKYIIQIQMQTHFDLD